MDIQQAFQAVDGYAANINAALSSFTSLELARLECLVHGHDYGICVTISPAFLTLCHRCGEDIQGRSIDDLEPMTDEDRELLEELDYLEEAH